MGDKRGAAGVLDMAGGIGAGIKGFARGGLVGTGLGLATSGIKSLLPDGVKKGADIMSGKDTYKAWQGKGREKTRANGNNPGAQPGNEQKDSTGPDATPPVPGGSVRAQGNPPEPPAAVDATRVAPHEKVRAQDNKQANVAKASDQVRTAHPGGRQSTQPKTVRQQNTTRREGKS